MKPRAACVVVGFLSLVLSLAAQTSSSSSAIAQVPPFIQFSNVATDVNGKPLSGMFGITFALYQEQQGGSPLWLETQNVQPDVTGHYTVLLGSTTSQGLPTSIFTAGEAHWLGIQVQGLEEQPRVLLVSAPYALKAGDAETVGGLPPSAFMLAAPGGTGPRSTSPHSGIGSSSPNVGGKGTQDYIPIWIDSSGDLGNSILYQSGGTEVGIGTTTPAATLDVNGSVISRGALQLPSTGTATALQGFNSQPFSLQGSSFNSSTGTAIGPLFQWQTEPSGNDTSNAAGTLNLLYGNGSGSPGETGLHIASTGLITFASGQTFPGTGTITGITTGSGSGLTGGGTSGTLNLSLTNSCAANQILQWNGTAWVCSTSGSGTITGVTAGTDLTGGGTSGNVTLNLDTTKVPQLNTANIFTGNQTVNGNLSATGIVTGSSFEIGSNLFAFGSYSNENAFLGFAGNSTMTGVQNTASGYGALANNTGGSDNTASGNFALFNNTGGQNTAIGQYALYSNSTGYSNTAIGGPCNGSTCGGGALFNNTTGSNNTALGAGAGAANSAGTGSNNTAVGAETLFGTGSISNATAIGASSEVTESNALVLGCIAGVNSCSANVNVGIGTMAPAYALDVHGTGNFTGLITFASGQTFPGTGTITGITTGSGSGLTGGGTSGTLNLSLTNSCAANQILQWNGTAWVCSTSGSGTITGVTAGTGLTGGGTSGNVTLNMNVKFANKYYAQLGAANTFTGNQTVNGNVSATGVVTGSSYQIGSNLFAFGSYANGNAFLGFAGNSTMTGIGNTASGYQALLTNTTGSGNTASGYQALGLFNTTGVGNTASGYQALSSNNANYNTGTGYEALYTNTTGVGNTATGYQALFSYMGGNYDTAIGYQALNGSPFSPGSNNTAVGALALTANSTGNNNTALGYDAGPDTKSTNLKYATAIGAGAVVSQSNALVLGGPLGSGANVNVGIGTATPSNVFTIAQTAGSAISDGWATYSSRRWKANIQPLHNALGMVEQLRGVSYDLKESGKHEIGVIAEEVGTVVPEVVSYEENGKDARGVDYSRLTALLIEATKEQQRELAKALRQIKQQQSLLRAQASAMRSLEAQVREDRETLCKVKAQVAADQPRLVAAK